MDAVQRPQTATQHQPLPSITSLTQGLPRPEQHLPASDARQSQSPPQHPHQHVRQQSDVRDSGNWSLSQGMSKHSSVVSNGNGLQLQTILNAEDAPSRDSLPVTPSSGRYPPHNAFPSINQGFDNRNSTASTDAASSYLDSRRSSVDNRMNNLNINNPSSPYESQNTSRVSLASSLQQQRLPTEQRTNGTSPLSPLGPRAGLANGARSNAPPRRAPVIQPNPRSVTGAPDPTAPAPTKGHPWAFPDIPVIPEHDDQASSSGSSNHRLSRQNSFAPSLASSAYTYDSTMPNGQKRFDDDGMSTHHHSMQHRSISNLQAAHDSAAASGGNYSRTPELRVSHKMAERKRRSEMKSLFDELNNILPNSPGSKSSKWEVLTKSIEHIRALQRNQEGLRQENIHLRPQAEHAARMQQENDSLKRELGEAWDRIRQLDPNGAHMYGPPASAFAQRSAPPPHTLPPPQPSQQPAAWAQGPANAMEGVQFANGHQYDRR